MRKLYKIIQSKEKIELEKMLFHSLKYIFNLEVKETGKEKSLVGLGKQYRSKIDWELEKMALFRKGYSGLPILMERENEI